MLKKQSHMVYFVSVLSRSRDNIKIVVLISTRSKFIAQLAVENVLDFLSSEWFIPLTLCGAKFFDRMYTQFIIVIINS